MATGAIDPATNKPYRDKRAVYCQVHGCDHTALYEEYGRYLCSEHSLVAEKFDHRRKNYRPFTVILMGLNAD